MYIVIGIGNSPIIHICKKITLCRAYSLDDEIIYYDINIYYTGPLALNSYFIGIDIFIYSIYPV